MTKILAGSRPKHAQLRDALAELAATELSPEAAIPSERDLMATYGVSRDTVRKAIDALVADGLLTRVHGRGTFVARPRLESRLHLASFSQDMRRRGLTPSTRLLARRAGPTAGRRGHGAASWTATRRPGGWTGSGSPTASRSRSRTAGTRRPPCPGSTGTTSAAPSTSSSRDIYGLTIDSAEQTLWGESADDAVAAAARRPAAHPPPRLPPRGQRRRPPDRVRRVPLPRRPLPDPHVSGS